MAPTYCGDGSANVPGSESKVSASNYQVWIGIGLSVFGAILAVIGLNLQRMSQVKNAQMSESERQGALSQPLNLLGGILMGAAALFDFVSFGFAPQSMLAPIGAVTLVLNMVMAPFTLGEKLSKKDVASTICVFVGIVIIIVFSDRETPEYSNETLQCLYLRPIFMVYATTVATLLLASLITIRRLDALDPPEGSKGYYVRRFLYPVTAGTFGGGSVLFAKSIVELLKSQFRGGSEFSHVGTYVCIVILAVCLSTQIRYLNAGLKVFEALYVVPIYQVFWVLVGILGGSIYFNEFWDYSQSQWVMYILGASMVVGGVLPLSARRGEGNGASDGLTVGAIVAVDADEMRTWASTRAMSLASGCYSASGLEKGPLPLVVGGGGSNFTNPLHHLSYHSDEDGVDSHHLLGGSVADFESAMYESGVAALDDSSISLEDSAMLPSRASPKASPRDRQA